jgi:oligosaccharide repeat unit polymerase
MSWNYLYVLDALAIALFAISYYWNCYRHGYRIDIWHTQLFFICVMPNMIMLPFSKNELNFPIVGQDFLGIVAGLPKIFLVTLVGYLAMLIGGSLWRFHLGFGTKKVTERILDILPQCSMMVMSSRGVLVFQAALCFSLQALLIGFYFSRNGFGFDLRQFTFAHPVFRPIALLISGYSIFVGSHCFARYMETKERVLLLSTLLLTFGLIFFGARSNILTIYFSVLLCYLIQLRTKVGLLKLTVWIGGIGLLGLYLGVVRSGGYSISKFFGLLAMLLFYGNTFSDLRDFAWVYADWNHHFWFGKTYLAALAAFVPRFASQFRDQWGLGAATALTVGFDPHVHPGLRPGSFGESFLNFGVPGVIVIGIILGSISRRVDIDVKRALTSSHPSMMTAFSSISLLGVVGTLAVSAGFSGLYLLVGFYFFTWLCRQVVRLMQRRQVSVVPRFQS